MHNSKHLMRLSLLSLNCENLSDLVPADPARPVRPTAQHRSALLAALIHEVDADVIGLVEAAVTKERTQRWFDAHVGGYAVHQAERRGVLGLGLAVRQGLSLQVQPRSKEECSALFALGPFDADGDHIREVYSWANRVPYEVVLSGADVSAPVTVIVIHAKSKGVFIPGDLYAYETQARASRMKLRAQAASVRARLNRLVDDEGNGRAVLMGDLNDSAEFDIYAAKLGGAFLEPVVGSLWDPARIFTDPHWSMPLDDRWTIDYKDRVVNPLTESRYGMPTDMRSWIDHILVSPELRPAVVPGSARIHHDQPQPAGLSGAQRGLRGTDHHPPSVALEL